MGEGVGVDQHLQRAREAGERCGATVDQVARRLLLVGARDRQLQVLGPQHLVRGRGRGRVGVKVGVGVGIGVGF